MDKGSGTSLALGLGLLIVAAVIVDAVFTGRKPWDIVLAVARGEAVPKGSTVSGVLAPSTSANGAPVIDNTKLPFGLGSVSRNLKVTAMTSYALAQVGKKYSTSNRFGPSSFDCSGLIIMAAKAAGLTVGPDSYSQANQGVAVDPQNIQPGDLLFFPGDSPRRNLGHVAIAISPTEMVQAANSQIGVVRSAIHFNDLEKVRRIV